MITLENSDLRVTIKETGAEMTSLLDKKRSRQCLWTGDPAFWGRQAPTLFPIVGRCKNNAYRYRGKTYSMGQHGFVRDAVFQVEKQSDTHVSLVYRSNEETLAVYPFAFTLRIQYDLFDDLVATEYQVVNDSEEEPLYFSIGGHPGFLLDGALNDQLLCFSERETLDRVLLAPSGQFSRQVEPAYIKEGKPLQLHDGIFENDALVFHNFRSRTLRLVSSKSGRGVEMNLEGFPYVGIWSVNSPGAPFVCIEPWFGLADYEDFEGELPQKDGILKIEPWEVFHHSFTVRPL